MSAQDPPRVIAVRAPAKVNLQLAVGPRGDDGYHPLATVFQAVALWETVVATPRSDGEITVTMDVQPTIRVPEGSVPLDETNLAVRAARAIATRYGVTGGVDLRIIKGVPVAGGMAGGSADAAAALVACSEALGVGATRGELDELAADLGSDVPFALHGHTAVGQGRGDRLTPAMARGEYHWVFALQAEGLSTPAVYAEFDRQVAEGERLAVPPTLDDELMMGLRAGDAAAVGARLSNDLQGAALRLAPHLAEVLDAAREAGALGAMISGSGPTVAALARSRQHGLAIAAAITAADVADGVVVASGPAAGAAVVSAEAL
jgi:4-diphosphocytidyl-2-C-methyl-D-erythritol kinase